MHLVFVNGIGYILVFEFSISRRKKFNSFKKKYHIHVDLEYYDSACDVSQLTQPIQCVRMEGGVLLVLVLHIKEDTF